MCRVVGLADQLTLARIVAVPLVVVLFAWGFPGHDYWATGTFIAAMATDWFDGRVARRGNQTSAFGSLLDPIADKILVLSVLIILIDQGGKRRMTRRPFDHALAGRHECQAPLSLFAKQPKVWGGVTNAEQPQPANRVPSTPDPASDEAAGDRPERLRVKMPQVDDVK